MVPHLMRHLRIRRVGRGRARTRPRPRPRRQGLFLTRGQRKRRGSRGGRPPAFDAADYRGRNVVERRFNLLKQWRGLATRYDKLAIVYRSAVVLHAVITWTKALSDVP
jgi:transposase